MGLFRKGIEPHCVYCARGRDPGDDRIACPKKGVLSGGDSCRSFRYDPLKRTPPRPVRLSLGGPKDEDFTL